MTQVAFCPRSLSRPHHSFWHAMDRLNVRHRQGHARKCWQTKWAKVWVVHQNWLLCLQQMRHSMKMSPSLTFRWQSGGMHCNQKLVRCSCSSETPSKIQRCGWSSASLACSVFCACQGGQCCFNERTKQALETDDDEKNE